VRFFPKLILILTQRHSTHSVVLVSISATH